MMQFQQRIMVFVDNNFFPLFMGALYITKSFDNYMRNHEYMSYYTFDVYRFLMNPFKITQ